MKILKPRKSYIIWSTPRTGSTLLCKALETTGVAGIPEGLFRNTNLIEHYNADNYIDLQNILWNKGTTENGIFGTKVGFYQPNNNEIIKELKKLPGGKNCKSRADIWENCFPDCEHIFITRRNKIRLAVSWWKAIKTNEYNRKRGDDTPDYDIDEEYHYDAINHLLLGHVFRESGIQEFFAEGNITPLTIVYEDFVRNYEETIYSILEYLEIPNYKKLKLDPPYFEKLADDLSEKWVQRFREERQKDWENIGW